MQQCWVGQLIFQLACHVSVIQSEKHKLHQEYIRFFSPQNNNVRFLLAFEGDASF